jgi:hypothetical protein
MMMQFTAKIATVGVDGWVTSKFLCFAKPTSNKSALHELLTKCEEKCGGYVSVKLDAPHRPRSTGWKSQNHHLYGHLRQLCEVTGYTMSELKQVVKEDTPSWPVTFKEFRGKKRKVYASESDVSVEVESEAIEICHRTAADLGVLLEEGDA